MVRASSSSKKSDKDEKSKAQKQVDPQVRERKRLKTLAFSSRILSATSSTTLSAPPLHPSATVLKHQGRDIVKKSQRKNRFLFSFPGLLAPISGGKIGELKDLGTKNPVLYLDFPHGRMKLFGTIVYPKNKYLTLQFSKGSKSVLCEDCFETMVVFSDAWWIGEKDENPEEARLDFPVQLDEGKHSDYDFKGGAGATFVEKSASNKLKKEYFRSPSPDTKLEDALSDDYDLTPGRTECDPMEVTPVRQSTRVAGKALNYAESSSGDGGDTSSGGEDGVYDMKEEGVNEDVCGEKSSFLSKTLDFSSPSDSEDVAEVPRKGQKSSLSKDKSTGTCVSKQGTHVQATLSTLFGKAKEKESVKSVKKSPKPKGSVQKKKVTKSIQGVNELKIGETSKKGAKGVPKKGAKTGSKTGAGQKHTQVEDDDIEEISSESEDEISSDEDWAA